MCVGITDGITNIGIQNILPDRNSDFRAQFESVHRFHKSRVLACDIVELQHLAEYNENELRASEQVREQLEQRIEQLELDGDLSERILLNLKSASSQMQIAPSNTPAGLSFCVLKRNGHPDEQWRLQVQEGCNHSVKKLLRLSYKGCKTNARYPCCEKRIDA